MSISVRLIGSGIYIPDNKVTAEEIDKKVGAETGWSEKLSGVKTRYFVTHESASYMAKHAILAALEDANLPLSEIDCIIGASGSMEQPIPCNAALIQEALGLGESGIACFDVNSTCLSFVVGLDMASLLIQSGRYNNILVVSSEVASNALNWGHNESCILFGDAAAAFVVSRTEKEQTSKIIASRLETYSKGAHLSEVRGGGTKYHPREHSEATKGEFLFHMDGQAIFKMSSRLLNGFIERLLDKSTLTLADVNLVVPHQASKTAMHLVRKKLNIREDQFMSIVETYGNTIASSIPLALHVAIKEGRVKRGDKVLLIGTSAGLSLGGIVLEY